MFLVYDIGGTNLRAGYSTNGETLNNVQIVPTPQDYDEGLNAMIKLGQSLSQDKVEKIVIGIAGVVIDNQLIKLFHLAGWSGKPLANDLAKTFNVQPEIRNDAEMAAIGEATTGAGQSYSSLLYFTVGTGVGGAWVNRADNMRTENLEPGHKIMAPENAELEYLVLQSDRKAHYLAESIRSSLKNYPSEAVILGGGMIINGHIDVEEIKSELGQQIPVMKTTLGDHAGLQGALYFANNK